MKSNRIKCNSINYRKGYVDVSEDVHQGFINIETWSVHPDCDISDIDLTDDSLPDEAVTGNTEIELNKIEAINLVNLLQKAIANIKE